MPSTYQLVEGGIERCADPNVPGGYRYRISNEKLRWLGEPDARHANAPKSFTVYSSLIDGDQIVQPFVAPHYSPADHERWRRLFMNIEHVLPGRAVQEVVDGVAWIRKAGGAERIPDIAAISRDIEAKSGFSLVPVMGLLSNDLFFKLLKQGRFPVTLSIRREHEFGYTSFPDLFHDLIGHAPMFLYPDFCSFVKKIGALGVKFAGQPDLQAMAARIYWYTIEFGLKATRGTGAKGKSILKDLRVYGAGIVSSATELQASVEATHTPDGRMINRLPFELGSALRRHYDFDRAQELYMVIESYAQLSTLSEEEMERLSRRYASGKDAIPQGKLLAEDKDLVIPANGSGI